MVENMKIWDAVAKTDPKHTKPVSFGARRFTSIDAHWQIKRMTEQFGPVGFGWGYDVQHGISILSDAVAISYADVIVWWNDGTVRRQYGPIRGMSPLLEKGRVDDDAPKKCLTDALTKGLSHLGMSADVFLGLFDDNKYVQKMTREFAGGQADALAAARADITAATGETRSTYDVSKDAKTAKPGRTAKQYADEAIADLNSLSSLADVAAWWDKRRDELDELEQKAPQQYERIVAVADDARASLKAHL